jgi:hypothetical protein
MQKMADRGERKAQSVEVDLLRPSPAILCALVSAVVHAEEFMSPGGHQFDLTAFSQCVDRSEVREWINGMVKAGFAPVKR